MKIARHRASRILGIVLLLELFGAIALDRAFAGVNRWTAIGPDGAGIVALAVAPGSPTTAFAGTLGSGVLLTTDGGTRWSSTGASLARANVRALAIDPVTPSIVYAGTDAGLFRSIDAGQHWTAADGGIPGAPQIRVSAVAIAPRGPAAVYAATEAGLFKTTDGALTWTRLDNGLAGLTPRTVTIDPVTPSTLYIGADNYADDFGYGAFKSTDAGASWTRIYKSPAFEDGGAYSVIAITVDPTAPSNVHIIADGLLRSTDGGASWMHVVLPEGSEPLSSLALDPRDGSLFATSYFGPLLLRSIDGGAHWTPLPNPPGAVGVGVVAPTGSQAPSVLVGARNGVFRTDDGTRTWTHLTLGLRRVGVGPVAVDPTAPSTIYLNAGGMLVKTIDAGDHWADAPLGVVADEPVRLAIDPLTPSTLYAVGFHAVYRSIDAGASWTQVPHLPTFVVTLVLAPSLPSTLYAAVNFTGVLKSADSGATWAPVNNGIIAVGPYVSALAVDPVDANIVFAATPPTGRPDTAAKLFKTVDGAAQWRQIPLAIPFGASINSFAIDPLTPSRLYATYADWGDPAVGKVIASVDAGETWADASGGLAPGWIWIVAIDPHSPSHLYAATSTGVFASADGARSWAPMNAGLDSLNVFDLTIDRTGTVLRAATDIGLYEIRLDPSAPSLVDVVEFYHAAFDHYFVTGDAAEIAKLDAGVFTGWARTGYHFNAYAPGDQRAAAAPVCRFFSTAFGPKSSHFITPFADECAAVQKNPDWLLESAEVFRLPTPDGACGAGFATIDRFYNNGRGGAPNHRYTIDAAARAQMLAQGWTLEGPFGLDGAGHMCSPPPHP